VARRPFLRREVEPDVDAASAAGVSCFEDSQGRKHCTRPRDVGILGEGEIPAAPSTDPGWTPLFLKASALVMEKRRYLSDGAIVAGEFGIPAVVNVPGILGRV
jgi:pyruvate,water dikinase